MSQIEYLPLNNKEVWPAAVWAGPPSGRRRGELFFYLCVCKRERDGEKVKEKHGHELGDAFMRTA